MWAYTPLTETQSLRNAKIVVCIHFYRAIHPYGMKNGNWAFGITKWYKIYWRKPNTPLTGTNWTFILCALCAFAVKNMGVYRKDAKFAKVVSMPFPVYTLGYLVSVPCAASSVLF